MPVSNHSFHILKQKGFILPNHKRCRCGAGHTRIHHFLQLQPFPEEIKLRQWVAKTYPIIIIDETQMPTPISGHNFPNLQHKSTN